MEFCLFFFQSPDIISSHNPPSDITKTQAGSSNSLFPSNHFHVRLFLSGVWPSGQVYTTRGGTDREWKPAPAQRSRAR